MMRGLPSVDVWNPHIVYECNSEWQKYLKNMSFIGTLNDVFVQNAKTFIQKHQEATQVIDALPGAEIYRTSIQEKFGCKSGWFPLAYKLYPILSVPVEDDKDDLALSKFGGVPDFTYFYDFVVPDEKLANKSKRQTCREALERSWPKCSFCRRCLKYLCQADLTDWLAPIQALTCHTPKGWHTPISGVGNGHLYQHISSSQYWFYIFYCDCGNYDSPNQDAHVIIQVDQRDIWNRMTKGLLKDLEPDCELSEPEKRNKCLWSWDEYMDETTKFMRENSIHPSEPASEEDPGAIPIQFIEGWDLRFDLDCPMRFDEYNEVIDGVYEGANEHDLFAHESPYQFFGRPDSQQGGGQRYFDEMGMRMSPIVSWSDSRHDITRQIYGSPCMTDHQDVCCRMDNSCT